MTPTEIMQIVSHHGDEEDMTRGEINNLIRYFIKKNCVWHSNESIGKIFGVTDSCVCRSVQVVENDRKYQFIKNRIQKVINEAILV